MGRMGKRREERRQQLQLITALIHLLAAIITLIKFIADLLG